MSWEWSHAPEAYENGRRLLGEKSLPVLISILAEWEATDWLYPDSLEGPALDLGEFHRIQRELKAEDDEARKAGVHWRVRREALAERIWEKAERMRVCTNGGHAAWTCPYGCELHLVHW